MSYNINSYWHLNDRRVYGGMPDNEPHNPDAPMSVILLLKLRGFPITQILLGKDLVGRKLVENASRQYQFCLDTEQRKLWGICFLFVKGKSNHFNKKIKEAVAVNEIQRIPLTYSSLSQMTDEELRTIWLDLD